MPREFVDLSMYLENDVISDPPPFGPKITYMRHGDTFEQIARFFPGLAREDLPDGEAWAVEATAPSPEEHARAEEADAAQLRSQPSPPSPPSPLLRPTPLVRPQSPPSTAPPVPALTSPSGSVTAHAGGPALSSNYAHDDVLIVVSKMKKYIRERSGMNTSDAVAEALGDHVRSVCDEAIRTAARNGRKTVLDRDVPKARR